MGAGRQQRDGYLDGSSSKYAHPLGAPGFWCLERLASGESHDPSAAITLAFSPGGGYALPGLLTLVGRVSAAPPGKILPLPYSISLKKIDSFPC